MVIPACPLLLSFYLWVRSHQLYRGAVRWMAGAIAESGSVEAVHRNLIVLKGPTQKPPRADLNNEVHLPLLIDQQ